MQYWIFFQPGVGGDGFSNLLEHANNVYPADEYATWRIHKKFNTKVKFYGAQWVENCISQPFRQYSDNFKDLTLKHSYIDIIENSRNTVIPVHYDYQSCIDYFPFRNVVEKDQVKIHLYSTNYERIVLDAKIKNQFDEIQDKTIISKLINQQLKQFKSYYDIHIDIEQVWQDWDYLNENLKLLDIDLNKRFYDIYMKIKGD